MNERRARTVPPARTREALDAMAQGPDLMTYVPPCCPEAGVRLSYKKGSGVLRISCHKCGTELAGVRIERERHLSDQDREV
jgi:hypothetical protein